MRLGGQVLSEFWGQMLYRMSTLHRLGGSCGGLFVRYTACVILKSFLAAAILAPSLVSPFILRRSYRARVVAL
jgi:hypothetical protein